MAAKRSSGVEMQRLRNRSPAVPRKTALNKVRKRTVVTGWYRWFIMYLSRMPGTALIIYPSMLKRNQSSTGHNGPLITAVYKKAVMCGLRSLHTSVDSVGKQYVLSTKIGNNKTKGDLEGRHGVGVNLENILSSLRKILNNIFRCSHQCFDSLF
jgi:hypothetical protein